jgi:N-acetylneuraminic acid mutarotase
VRSRVYSFIFVSIFIVFSVITTAQGASSASDYWITKTPSLHSLGQHTGRVASLDGMLYAVTMGSNLEVYNPNTDEWVHEASVPGNLNTFAVVAYGNRIYVIGNGANDTGAVTYVNEAYDPESGTWENKTALDTLRWDMQANVVDDKIYIISGGQWGGFGAFWPIQSNDVYDPSNDSWSQMAAIPTPVAFYASTVMDNMIYIIGGMSTYVYKGVNTYVNFVQIFDPEINSWIQGPPLPNAMYGMAACTTSGLMAAERIYVIGGYGNNGAPNVNWTQIYNPKTRNWSIGVSMPTTRGGLSLVNVNDSLYAMGGADSSGNFLTTNEKYTPANYGLVPSPSLSTSPSPSATILPTSSVPEFPSWIIVPLIFAGSIVSFALKKRCKR